GGTTCSPYVEVRVGAVGTFTLLRTLVAKLSATQGSQVGWCQIQLTDVRRTVGFLVATADTGPIRNRPVKQGLIGIHVTHGAEVRMTRTQLQVQLLNTRQP